MYNLKMFSPILRLSFHCFDGVLVAFEMQIFLSLMNSNLAHSPFVTWASVLHLGS